MIEKSVFGEGDIIREIFKNYNIKTIKIEKESRGSANIYYIYDIENNKYVLKEFEFACNEKNVVKEVNIIEHLRKYNLKVPEYIKTLDNKYYFNYKTKTIILMKYVEGYTKNTNTGNLLQTLESATLLGKMVKALESYPYMEEENIEKWYDKTKIIEGKNSIIDLQNKVKENQIISQKVKEEILLDVKSKLFIISNLEKMNFEGMQKVTHKNSHGDFSIMQFIYNKEKISAVLDFAKARAFPISWEIIRSYTYIDEECKEGNINIEHLIMYIKEFIKYVKLNKYDLKFMPHVYLIQLVTSTFGYKEYLNNIENTELLKFGHWRTKISEYIYNNIDYISKRLSEIDGI